MLEVILVVVIVVIKIQVATASKVEHATHANGNGDEQADADQDGRHRPFSLVFNGVVVNDLGRHLTERPDNFTFGGSRVFGHGSASVVADIKTGEGDDVPLALETREHALRWGVANQGERQVNTSVGFHRHRWAGGLVPDQFDGGRRAGNDLPCEPNHDVERVRVGHRAGDANVRGVAVPFVGRIPTINDGAKGCVGEGRTSGLVGLVGGVGFVARIRCRSKGKRVGKFREVERRRRGSELDHQAAVVGAGALDAQFVSSNLGRAVLGFRSRCIGGVPPDGQVGQVHALRAVFGLNIKDGGERTRIVNSDGFLGRYGHDDRTESFG